MPRTVLPDSRLSPRFAGIATFCRYPRLQDVLPENLPLDWAIYGVPFDGGVTYRPGSRFGPRAVREASQYVKRFHLEHNVDVCAALSMADAGDAPVSPFSIPETLDRVADFAADLTGDAPPGNAPRLMAVGGDHSISYANLRAAYAAAGEPASGLALIHFDAHLDTVDQVWGEKFSHASPFRRAVEEGFVDPRQMLSIGIRGPLNDAADLEFAAQRGVTIVTDRELRSRGYGPGGGGLNLSTVASFVQRIGDAPAYLTFDIDVIDPAFAPGTGTPCPGGLATHEAFAILRSLAGVRLAGADVVEVLPDRDPAGHTALVAAHVMFEILALDAVRRRTT